MIRIVVVAAACIACVGAIGAAATNPKPDSPGVVFPVAAANKADRLPISSSNVETLTTTDKAIEEKVGSTNLLPPQADLAGTPAPLPQEQKKTISVSAPYIVPRHWHDPHSPISAAARAKATDLKQAKKSPASNDGTRECRSDGLYPILRKLSLAPGCTS